MAIKMCFKIVGTGLAGLIVWLNIINIVEVQNTQHRLVDTLHV
jgi:hypothetical protein